MCYLFKISLSLSIVQLLKHSLSASVLSFMSVISVSIYFCLICNPYANCLLNMLTAYLINRNRLFALINDLPTVYEIASGRKPSRERPILNVGNKPMLNAKVNP